MDVPLSCRLGSAFREIENTVISAHKRAAEELVANVYKRSLKAKLRASEIACKRLAECKPLGFICHDWRDKRAVARPIAIALSELGCPVWYDEFALRVGDRLRESIERGLTQARKCIVILSPNFLSNRGWTRAEFNSIFTRELIEDKKLFLPVWAGVSRDRIFDYSPTLADRLGVNWALGAQEVVKQLYLALSPRT
jgi:hypothetical protein